MTRHGNDDIVLAAIGLISGAILFYRGFVARQRCKLMERTPTSKVRSAAVGLVELQGQAAVVQEPLRSPFAQVECVYYSYRVQEHRRSGKKSRWVTISEGSSQEAFSLRDDTGDMVIMPSGADYRLRVDRSYQMSSFSFGGQEVVFKTGLDRLGIPYGGFWGERRLRGTETYILAGDPLYVLGTAMLRDGSAGSARNEENLFIGLGRDGWFVISDRSERELLSSLRWTMYGMVFGGPVLSLVCLVYVLRWFGIL